MANNLLGRPLSASSDDKEEGLLPYRAVLDFNPKEVSSGESQVLGIKHIKSAPTRLESTSLVLAYG